MPPAGVDSAVPAPPALITSYQDMRRHLASLIYDGFIINTPPPWLAHYSRFLAAMDIRLRKLLEYMLGRHSVLRKEMFAHRRELVLWTSWGLFYNCRI